MHWLLLALLRLFVVGLARAFAGASSQLTSTAASYAASMVPAVKSKDAGETRAAGTMVIPVALPGQP